MKLASSYFAGLCLSSCAFINASNSATLVGSYVGTMTSAVQSSGDESRKHFEVEDTISGKFSIEALSEARDSGAWATPDEALANGYFALENATPSHSFDYSFTVGGTTYSSEGNPADWTSNAAFSAINGDLASNGADYDGYSFSFGTLDPSPPQVFALNQRAVFFGVEDRSLKMIEENETPIRFDLANQSLSLKSGRVSIAEGRLDDVRYQGTTGSFELNSLKFAVFEDIPIVAKTNGDKQVAIIGDIGGGFDPTKPTIVVTHGWQPGGSYSGNFGNVDILDEMYLKVKRKYPSEVNVVLATWEGAFTNGYLTPAQPLPFAPDSGNQLGSMIADLIKDRAGELGLEYEAPIHLIGHSYGTLVNLSLASTLSVKGFPTAHMTLLDAPTRLSGSAKEMYEWNAQNASWIEYFENYYGTGTSVDERDFLAVGLPLSGANPDGGYPIATGHAGVWRYYADSVEKDDSEQGGFIYSAALEERGKFKEVRNSGEKVSYAVETALLTPLQISARSAFLHGGVTVETASDGYAVFLLEVPENIDLLLFDLTFSKLAKGDWLEISFGEDLLAFFGEGSDGIENMIQVFDFSGYRGKEDRLSFMLFNDGGETSSVFANNFRFISKRDALAPSPVPLPASGYMLLLVCLVLGLAARSQTNQKT